MNLMPSKNMIRVRQNAVWRYDHGNIKTKHNRQNKAEVHNTANIHNGTSWAVPNDNADILSNIPATIANDICIVCGKRLHSHDGAMDDHVSCVPVDRSLDTFMSFADQIPEPRGPKTNQTANQAAAARSEHCHGEDDKFAKSLCKYINDNLIGKDTVVNTPFGYYKVIYLDYTASGRNVKFIEAYIRQHVLPIYANTHSEATCCAEQTEKYREEARTIIKKCVNACDQDVTLFVGSGCTSAVHKLIDVLNIRHGATGKITVLLSALEHHSNILPWKEIGLEIIRIPLNNEGTMDLSVLSKTLKKLASEERTILCTFTAASNVTGIFLDTETISSLVHSYGGYVFWDYAAAGPHKRINMNSSDTAYKDAVFLSGHKFIGGPGSPGILIAKKYLFKNPVPSNVGGGTVLMVTKSSHLYYCDIEKREEGGTPDIIGAIRAGLAFQLKRAITDEYVEKRDCVLISMFFQRLLNNKRIVILGNPKLKRLPIFSFLIVHQPTGMLIHHNFVSRLLNDLFGIQSRPGCVCAGPYTQDLLNIHEEFALKLVALQTAGSEQADCWKCDKNCLTILKAGFTRINIPYFFSDSMVIDAIEAVQFVADHGWCFLPQYKYDVNTGFFYHRTFNKKYNSLEKITYENGRMYFEALVNNGEPVTALLSHATNKLREAKELAACIDFSSDPPVMANPSEDSKYRWFLLPSEAARIICKGKCEKKGIPFHPLDARDRIKCSSSGQNTKEEKDKIYISKKKKETCPPISRMRFLSKK